MFASSHFRVAEKEPVNKMSLHNLATVFGPTLLRPSESESSKAHITLASDIWSHDVMAQVSPGLHTHCSRLVFYTAWKGLLEIFPAWIISYITLMGCGLVCLTVWRCTSLLQWCRCGLWLFHHLYFHTVITHCPHAESGVLGIFSSLVYFMRSCVAHLKQRVYCVSGSEEMLWLICHYGLVMICQKLNKQPEPSLY